MPNLFTIIDRYVCNTLTAFKIRFLVGHQLLVFLSLSSSLFSANRTNGFHFQLIFHWMLFGDFHFPFLLSLSTLRLFYYWLFDHTQVFPLFNRACNSIRSTVVIIKSLEWMSVCLRERNENIGKMQYSNDLKVSSNSALFGAPTRHTYSFYYFFFVGNHNRLQSILFVLSECQYTSFFDKICSYSIVLSKLIWYFTWPIDRWMISIDFCLQHSSHIKATETENASTIVKYIEQVHLNGKQFRWYIYFPWYIYWPWRFSSLKIYLEHLETINKTFNQIIIV